MFFYPFNESEDTKEGATLVVQGLKALQRITHHVTLEPGMEHVDEMKPFSVDR